MKQGIFKKNLILIIFLSLIPFIFINIYFFIQLKNISKFAINRSKTELDKKAITSLINQANDISKRISDFLYSCVNDLNDLSIIPPNINTYLQFSLNHQRLVFDRIPDYYNAYTILKKYVPVYSVIAFVDYQGNEKIKIENNIAIRDKNLKNLSKKNFFKKLKNLKNGDIYFSHLIGSYVSKKEALAGADAPESALGGKKYRGYFILAKKVSSPIEGFLILHLNHIHIMEFVLHVLPNSSKFIDYPVYSSGNYAFLVDDLGWTIAHPKIWDIRGYDKNGKFVPPYSIKTPKNMIEKGVIPFNLAYAGFIHKNYPNVLKKIQQKKSGCVNTTNIGGINKVMAFAPIFFNISEYKKYGIFGGVTIGANMNDFHKPALVTQKIIKTRYNLIKNKIVIITFIIIFLIIAGSLFFTSQITAPIILLSRRFTELGRGNYKKVDFKRNDEIGVLGEEFNRMIDLIKANNEKLSKTIKELEISKRELEFKVNLLDGIREFFTKFNHNNKLEEIINSILLIGKKIFKYDYCFIKLFDISKDFHIGLIEVENPYKITNSIIIENSPKGIIEIYKNNDDFTNDEKKHFEIFTLSFSKFLENLKLYSEILKERNFIESIFKNMINGLIYINNDGYITHVNEMALKMLKIDKTIIGDKFRNVFRNIPALIDFYMETIKGKEFMFYELNLNDRIYACSSNLIENNKGIIMLFRDITEKKLMDEHLKRVDRLASLGRLAAGIAHEIRNPLTGINLVLEDLHDKLDNEDKKLIKKSLHEISRLDNIVSELLDYASPVKENFQLSNIDEIIESSIFFIKKQAKKKNIEIMTNINFSANIYCSPEKLKQAIINMLINSIDAIDMNGKIEIEVNKGINSNELLLSVEDNGSGISNEDIKFIFDPFFTTKKGGTGLGLSITHSIIHEHNGRIIVESKERVGTKFTIILPMEH